MFDHIFRENATLIKKAISKLGPKNYDLVVGSHQYSIRIEDQTNPFAVTEEDHAHIRDTLLDLEIQANDFEVNESDEFDAHKEIERQLKKLNKLANFWMKKTATEPSHVNRCTFFMIARTVGYLPVHHPKYFKNWMAYAAFRSLFVDAL